MKNKYELGLLAISGDCAEGGMSNKADFIKFSDKYINLIKNYLRNQLELELFTLDNDILDKSFSKLVKEHNNLGNKLIDVGVFKHKWHKRTYWSLDEENENV